MLSETAIIGKVGTIILSESAIIGKVGTIILSEAAIIGKGRRDNVVRTRNNRKSRYDNVVCVHDKIGVCACLIKNHPHTTSLKLMTNDCLGLHKRIIHTKYCDNNV